MHLPCMTLPALAAEVRIVFDPAGATVYMDIATNEATSAQPADSVLCLTPCTAVLPPGEHRLRVAHPDMFANTVSVTTSDPSA